MIVNVAEKAFELILTPSVIERLGDVSSNQVIEFFKETYDAWQNTNIGNECMIYSEKLKLSFVCLRETEEKVVVNYVIGKSNIFVKKGLKINKF